eukprot:scaffold59337_cov35-Tisochrysis_lutea.AAC.1
MRNGRLSDKCPINWLHNRQPLTFTGPPHSNNCHSQNSGGGGGQLPPRKWGENAALGAGAGAFSIELVAWNDLSLCTTGSAANTTS